MINPHQVTEPHKTGTPFFLRYWYLLLATAISLYFAISEWAFQQVGTLGYAAAFVFLGITLAMFARHTIFRTTIKKYVEKDGGFTAEWWNELTPWQRQLLTCAYTLGFLVAAALIINGVAK